MPRDAWANATRKDRGTAALKEYARYDGKPPDPYGGCTTNQTATSQRDRESHNAGRYRTRTALKGGLPHRECTAPRDFPSRPILIRAMLDHLRSLRVNEPEKHLWLALRDGFADSQRIEFFCGCVSNDRKLDPSVARMIYAPDPSADVYHWFAIWLAQCPHCQTIYWTLRR